MNEIAEAITGAVSWSGVITALGLIFGAAAALYIVFVGGSWLLDAIMGHDAGGQFGDDGEAEALLGNIDADRLTVDHEV